LTSPSSLVRELFRERTRCVMVEYACPSAVAVFVVTKKRIYLLRPNVLAPMRRYVVPPARMLQLTRFF
jgi:hypothetical protein